MNIGLDIDNVITDFDKDILKGFLVEDKLKRNRGIINPNARHINEGMFDWTAEEVHDFYCRNMEQIAKTLPLRRGAKKYMQKLVDEGHKLILISHRAYPHYLEPEKTTLDWLEKKGLPYTKLVLSKTPGKVAECVREKIDIIFDDRVDSARYMRQGGVNCYVMLTRYNRARAEDLPFVSSWVDLYEEVQKCKK